MKKLICFLCLLLLCVGLCACSDMPDVESELRDDYKLTTLTHSDLTSLAEPLDLDVDDYNILKAVQATHRDHGYSVVIIECSSDEDASKLETDVFSKGIVNILSAIYGSSFSFMTNSIDSFALIGERRAAKDAYTACKEAGSSGFLLWLIIIVGILCVCGYISQRITSNKGYYGGFAWGFFLGPVGIYIANNQPAAPESTAAPAPTTEKVETTPKNSTPPVGHWQCKCGRSNAQYVRTCVCGLSKIQVLHSAAANNTPSEANVQMQETPTPAATTNSAETKAPDPDTNAGLKSESEKIAILKEYKELLDSGIITEEDFQEKKHQILDN